MGGGGGGRGGKEIEGLSKGKVLPPRNPTSAGSGNRREDGRPANGAFDSVCSEQMNYYGHRRNPPRLLGKST